MNWVNRSTGVKIGSMFVNGRFSGAIMKWGEVRRRSGKKQRLSEKRPLRLLGGHCLSELCKSRQRREVIAEKTREGGETSEAMNKEGGKSKDKDE